MKRRITAAAILLALAGVLGAAMPAAAAQVSPARLIAALGPGSYIGANVREVTSEDAKKANLEQPAGALVESVREDSPAAKAGLQPGDIVIELDGERVRSVRHFTRLVQESAPNRTVAMVVVRGTSRQTMAVVPEFSGEVLSRDLARQIREALPREFGLEIDPDGVRRRDGVRGGALGVTLTPLSAQLADYFEVEEGALVSSVASGSAAAQAGLKAGDVITAINGRHVTNAADAAEIIRSAPDGSVEISVTRDRRRLSLKATIPARPGASGRRGLPV